MQSNLQNIDKISDFPRLTLLINSQDSADFPSFQIFAKHFWHIVSSLSFFSFSLQERTIPSIFNLWLTFSLIFLIFLFFIWGFLLVCLFLKYFHPILLLISFSFGKCILNVQEIFLVFFKIVSLFYFTGVKFPWVFIKID